MLVRAADVASAGDKDTVVTAIRDSLSSESSDVQSSLCCASGSVCVDFSAGN